MSSSASVCTYREGEEEEGYILTSNEKVDRTIEYGERYNYVVIIEARL